MKWICTGLLVFLAACGVKGKPVALETPPPIGHGYPIYEEKPESGEGSKLRKKTLALPEDDFKEPPDFNTEGE